MAAAIPLIATGIGAAVSLKGQSDAKKAAAAANDAAQKAQVNIPQVSQMATDQALKNIQMGRQVEQQYDPQNAALRQDSVIGLLAQLGQNPNQDIYNQLMGQFQNGGSTYGGGIADRLSMAQGAAPLAGQIANAQGTSIADQIAQSQGGAQVHANTADSGLLQAAIKQATDNLALGGSLPQDVKNLVARTAAGKSAGVSGGLGLGRDISARDLGLTSLDLLNQRLASAQSLGQSELAGKQFNSQLGLQADTTNSQLGQQNSQFNVGQRNAALSSDQQLAQQLSQFNAGQRNNALLSDAQMAQQNAQYNAGARNNALQFDSGQLQQANQFGASNNLNLAQMLSSLNGQDFSKYLAASQFGQQLATPTVGLDPSAIANLAVGNSNTSAQAGLNAAGIKAQGANNLTNFGGQLFGYGFGNLGSYGSTAQPAANSYQAPSYYNPTMASANGATGANLTKSYGF